METLELLKSESFDINQETNKYKLIIEIYIQNIKIIVLENNELHIEYELNLNLEELKLIHKIFLMFSTCQEFLDLIKVLIEKNKLTIIKLVDNEISVELNVEYLYQQNTIKFDLSKKKINFELIALDIYKQLSIIKDDYNKLDKDYTKIKDKNRDLEKENNTIKNEINILKEENKNLNEQNHKIIRIIKSLQKDMNNLLEENNDINKKIKSLNNEKVKNIVFKKKNKINSSIMNIEEYEMIESIINQRMNKEIKHIKKLYQASIDGGEPSIFHKKCNNKPNTLVLYKSAGNRRFGGFASECWKSQGTFNLDEKCFLFSLDNKKIYLNKDDNYFIISCNARDGPSFGYKDKYCIRIQNDAIKNATLKTNEITHKEIFADDIYALSEDGNFKGVYAKEYEVFEVIF